MEEWKGAERVFLQALPSLDGVCVLQGERMSAVFAERVGAGPYRDFLKTFFSGAVRKVSHDGKDLMHQLLGEGLTAEGFVFDTALAAYLLAPTDGSYAMDKLAISYFNTELPSRKDWAEPEAWGPLADPAPALAALSAWTGMVAALYEALSPKLEELGMHELYYQVDLPLCPVLARMERAGMLVDRRALAAFGEMLDGRIEADVRIIYELAGEEFNINSTQQLGRVLFEQLGLPPVKKTKTGYSTNVEVLEKLRGKHPIIDVIMDYRQLAKLKSTYVDGLTKVIADDGRIHTSFQNTVTTTGRLSSTEPNLQNIPVRTELGAELRKMFVAPAGYKLVDADYIERYLGHYAGVRDYRKRVVEQARQDGYVSTLMGRRRWLPELKSSNFNLRAFGERVALNMPIQGTAADLIKLAMIRVDDRLRREGLAARLILQVHDELIVECPDAEVERVKALLTEEMEGVAALSVPMKADSAAGQSWAEAKE